MPYDTKKRLGEALLTMLEKKNLDKITVAELTSLCGINRQTFYYHFRDVYELAEWMIDQEAEQLSLSENVQNESWESVTLAIFKTLDESRSIALHLYKSQGWRHIMDYVRRRASPILEARGRALMASMNLEVDEDDFLFIVRAYQYSFYGVIDAWLAAGMKDGGRENYDRLMLLADGTFEFALRKFASVRGRKRDN